MWTWRFSCAFCCCSVSADFLARPSLQCLVHGAVCIYRSMGRCGFRHGPAYICTYIGPRVVVGSGVDLFTYVPIKVHGSVWVQAWACVYIAHGSVWVQAWAYVYIAHGSVWVQAWTYVHSPWFGVGSGVGPWYVFVCCVQCRHV